MSSFNIKKLFSIKLENTHFVLCILGIKLKFRYNYVGYNISGKGNKIIYVNNGKEYVLSHFQKIQGLKISIKGDNNIIRIAHKNFKNVVLRVKSNNSSLVFKENDRLIRNLYVSAMYGDGQYLEWGRNTSVIGAKVFLNEENSSFIVGDDCMLSDNITIWATDAHAILDKQSSKVLNVVTKPLRVGNNCWIGYGSYLLKNTKLPDNTIVGSNSVVTGVFEEEFTAIAGNPAKVVKRNIRWDRRTAWRVIKDRDVIENRCC